ncbi:MAG: menaquinone biosynthetic enzyme MqnA/MqnD family protein [Phycisphaerales bacterium]
MVELPPAVPVSTGPLRGRSAAEIARIGVVRFVNTLPLIDGLEDCRDVALHHAVPSQLIDRLTAGDVDIALCSSIDFQRATEPLVILPVGHLGCDGPTLTVRLYARRPIEQLDRVHCDTDSHTSVALLRIVLREQFGIDPEFVPFDAEGPAGLAATSPEAMLLIGDKVVTDSPAAVRYPHQIDLGAAWHELTGLPFVFAVWLARESTAPDLLCRAGWILDRQRRRNRAWIDRIVHDRVLDRGWPRDLASEYLGRRIRYDFGPRAQAGLAEYWRRAGEHGLIAPVKPMQIAELSAPPATCVPG